MRIKLFEQYDNKTSKEEPVGEINTRLKKVALFMKRRFKKPEMNPIYV